MPVSAAIPTFKLYGEDHDWPTPDLLHWESIAQRSRQHDWVIKPHRHGNLLQLIYIESGIARTRLDGRNLLIDSPTLLVIPQLTVHGFEFSPDTCGHVLTLASPLLMKIFATQGGQSAGLQKAGVISVAGEEKRRLDYLMTAIAGEYLAYRDYRDTMLQNLTSQLLVWIARQHAYGDTVPEKSGDKGELYYSQFQQLVELHYREHRPLDFYAEKLQISTPHLNSICRQVADVSALRVIHERVLLEAKRNLIYTAYTVREISDGLGFSEPAYFTRFFNRLQKISPQEFRRRESW